MISGQSKNMATPRSGNKGGLILALSLALFLILLVGSGSLPIVECQQQEQLTVESRHQKGANNDLTETINQLEQMDKFFSELARPRFGRSEFKQPTFAASRGFGASEPVGQHLPYRGTLTDSIRSRLLQKYRDPAAY